MWHAKQKLISLLQKDSLFLQTIIHLGNTWQQKYTKDTVSVNTLMDIAAHFFYLTKITANGRLLVHVCAKTNGLNDLKNRQETYNRIFCF